MGAGRSGSTILGILIGNLPDCIYTGELHYWNIYKGIPNNQQLEVVEFWANVKNNFKDCEKYFGMDFYKYLEYHTSFLFLPWVTKRNLINDHLTYTKSLCQEIFNFSNRKYIVDSSHYPLRARLLLKNKNINLKVIYLYKDPVSVLNSFSKQAIEHKSKHPLAANIYLFCVSLLSLFVYYTLPKHNRLKIRYEDIIEKPGIMIEALTNFLGLPNCKIDFSNLNTGYSIQSNRIRHSSRIALNNDDSKINVGSVWKIFTNILQSPFLLMNRKVDFNNL